jgi:hypothetical protein
VRITLSVVAVVKVIERVVSPSLHNTVPPAATDIVEVLLQLLTTVIAGAAGVVCGEDPPTP